MKWSYCHNFLLKFFSGTEKFVSALFIKICNQADLFSIFCFQLASPFEEFLDELPQEPPAQLLSVDDEVVVEEGVEVPALL
jgi:hypothetical protein